MGFFDVAPDVSCLQVICGRGVLGDVDDLSDVQEKTETIRRLTNDLVQQKEVSSGVRPVRVSVGVAAAAWLGRRAWVETGKTEGKGTEEGVCCKTLEGIGQPWLSRSERREPGLEI